MIQGSFGHDCVYSWLDHFNILILPSRLPPSSILIRTFQFYQIITMKVLATLSAALAAGLTVNAAPTIEKRGLSANDSNTLSLALYLEHLEFALYSGGFNAFDDAAYEADGFPPGYRENINVIAGVWILPSVRISSLTYPSMKWSTLIPLLAFSPQMESIQSHPAPTASHTLHLWDLSL
jgi:hypothetical protein